jgi:metal-responsive CopG/Arc/MetJ family transcriptional regulator
MERIAFKLVTMESNKTTKASIVLPDEIFTELARRAPRQDERSKLITEALRYFFSTHQTNDFELEQINSYAEELNQEAEDVLNYQVIR